MHALAWAAELPRSDREPGEHFSKLEGRRPQLGPVPVCPDGLPFPLPWRLNAKLGLLGALLGTVAGYVGMIGWLRGNSVSGSTAALANVPVANLPVILLGMPAIAVVLWWVLSGREPPATIGRAIE